VFRRECPGSATFPSHIRLAISDNAKVECVEELMVHPDGRRTDERRSELRFGEFRRAVCKRAITSTACMTHVGGYEGRFGNNFISRCNLRERDGCEQENTSGAARIVPDD